MSEQKLKQLITYNQAYRDGNPLISDADYDKLFDEYKEQFPEDFKKYSKLLGESSGDTNHLFVIGSLEKIKNGDDNKIKKFNKTAKEFIITPKLDGASLTLYYVDGILSEIVTRGDGYTGKSYFNKIKGTMGIPETIDAIETIVCIRGEIIIENENFIKLNEETNGKYNKHPRNAIVGLLNEKSNGHLIKKYASFHAYDVLTSNIHFTEYGECLNWLSNKFNVPQHIKVETFDNELLLSNYNNLLNIVPYEIDGLVIRQNILVEYSPDYYPEYAKAYKANENGAETKVVDIEWNVSKDGKVVPTIIVEPVDIAGSTITRANGCNAEYILERGIGIGAIVRIQKLGEIIPGVTQVVDRSDNYEIPNTCPDCGSVLIRDGRFIICKNKNCKTQKVKSLETFLKKLDVNFAGELNLRKWGLYTIIDLIEFSQSDSSLLSAQQKKFIKELKDKFWKASEETLIKSFDYAGIGTKIITKILDLIGLDKFIEYFIYNKDSIEITKAISSNKGLTEDTISRIKYGINRNDLSNSYFSIISNSKWKPVSAEIKKDNKLIGCSFCFTGALTIPRKTAEAYVKNFGGTTTSTVNEKLTYLVTNNINSGTSKAKKALQLKTTILNEKQFCDLVGLEYKIVEQSTNDFNEL